MSSKVLLVDDESYILKALERLLTRSGYRVFTASSGTEALQALQNDPCQVVISDFRMPEMNGAELLTRINKLYPDIVCLILSGFSDFQSVLQLINSGAAFRFLQKPWEDDQLLSELEAAFGLYSLRRSERVRSQMLIAGHGALLELNSQGVILRSNGVAQKLLRQKALNLNLSLLEHWFQLDSEQQQAFLRDVHGSIEVMGWQDESFELHVQYKDAEATLVGFRPLDQQDGPSTIYTSGLMDQHTVLQQFCQLLQGTQPFAAAAIRLKNYNDWADMLGFAEAGQLFETISQSLMRASRSVGSLAYLANELFILTLPQAPDEVSVHQQLTDLFQKVRLQLEKQALAMRPQFTVSYCLAPEDGNNPKLLMNNLLTSNRIHLHSQHTFFMRFSADLADKKRRQLMISEALYRAVELDQLELYFQAKLNLKQNRITSCEALLRWRHPDLGTVSPALFIPIAEHDGQIIEIGFWVIRQACLTAVRWCQQYGPFQKIAVNISGVQLAHASFIEQVGQIFTETGVNPSMLEFELTESWMMQDLAQSVQSLQALKALGVRISIDDFGTGYSSLAHLSRLPVDVLKIDRVLIQDLENSINTQCLVSNICRMAHALHVEVVVEGVENPEQLQLLRDMGCDVAQGYFIARPVAETEYRTYCDAWQNDAEGGVQ